MADVEARQSQLDSEAASARTAGRLEPHNTMWAALVLDPHLLRGAIAGTAAPLARVSVHNSTMRVLGVACADVVGEVHGDVCLTLEVE